MILGVLQMCGSPWFGIQTGHLVPKNISWSLMNLTCHETPRPQQKTAGYSKGGIFQKDQQKQLKLKISTKKPPKKVISGDCRSFFLKPREPKKILNQHHRFGSSSRTRTCPPLLPPEHLFGRRSRSLGLEKGENWVVGVDGKKLVEGGGFNYTPPKQTWFTWKWGPLGKWDSYWKPSFPGSMLIFGGVFGIFINGWLEYDPFLLGKTAYFQVRTVSFRGGIFVIFIPKIGESIQIWLIFFWDGWFNHQLVGYEKVGVPSD